MSDSHGTPHAVCYGISAYNSNAMLSDNPHSGIYEANTSRTLDGNGGNPACNQGGIAVVCVDQGGGKSACNITENMSPTLTCTHGGESVVCLQGPMIGRKENDTIYSMSTGTWGQVNENIASCLLSRDYKDAQIVTQLSESDNCEIHYVVRRLTPTECARLQGFPDWWCSNLGTDNPTEEDIAFWTEVWETHRKIMGKNKKPKTRNQIIKWLQNPHSDAAEYKMWGNGVALPCVTFILSGIAEVLSKEGN